ncbi:MAG: SEC-C metal-binding domain-containing protein [Acidimicrobiia bacterium]
MDLDDGTLARIDRKLLARLQQGEMYRMVRVPVTPATWKRYCDSAGVSMGRAIVALIDRELVTVFGDQTDDHRPWLVEQAEDELARRQEQVGLREEKAAVVEERLRAWNAHLRRWEGELETRERRVEFAAKMAARAVEAEAKVGRNERCPCGSGLKYKHCQGLPDR